MLFQHSQHGVIVCGNGSVSDWNDCLLLAGESVGQGCRSPCPSLAVIWATEAAITYTIG